MQAVQLLAKGPAPIYSRPGHAEPGFGAMIGRSPIMQRLFSQMRHTARHLRTATIEGETGTGKLLAARTLHDHAGIPQSPFVPCLAVRFFESHPPITLVPAPESGIKPEFLANPAFRHSCGGTLVLTRIDELGALQQARLLEMLQWIDHQHILRSLASIPRQVLCLSSQPLRQLAATGALRGDLATRLTTVRFVLPPLRERREDIPLLAEHFVQQFSASHGKSLRGLGPQTLPRLVQHPWPGNIRELESMISAASLNCEGQWIRPIDLPAFTAKLPAQVSSVQVDSGVDDPNLDRAIMRHVQRVLATVDGNKLRAAKLLGISRSTLYRLLETNSAGVNSQS